MRIACLLIALSFVLPSVALAQGNEPPRASEIQADLSPPTTTYRVEAYDPEGRTLTYTWEIAGAGACGRFFVPGRTSAVWTHDDPEACPHDAASHPGTITVRITDGTSAISRSYGGGSAAHRSTEDWDRPGYGITTGGNGTDPRDETPPVVYGEEIECEAVGTSGAFQPSQGVWQDDPEFPDKSGKQLRRIDDTHAVAELPMVAQRPTRLFGVRPSWEEIHLRTTLQGYIEVPAVVRFTLTQRGSPDKVVYDHDVGLQPIRGECLGANARDLLVPSRLGVPHATFAMQEGSYTVRMELVEKATGAPVPGTQVEVRGEATTMPRHRVYFVPVALTDITAAEAAALVDAATATAAQYAAQVPDYLPLAPGTVSVVTRPEVHDLVGVLEDVRSSCNELEARIGESFFNCEEHMLRARVEGRLHAGTWSQGAVSAGQGAGRPERVVIWIREIDMDHLGWDGAQAFAPSTKSVFVRQSSDHWDVAHEIVHTMPRHLWSKVQMIAACGPDYHNNPGFSHGVRITESGRPAGTRYDDGAGLMGAATSAAIYWMEQCTYWHLLTALKQKADPPLFGIRGVVAVSEGGTHAAILDRGYSFDGSPDLDQNATEGAYALLLKGAANTTLARYAFDVPLEDEEGRPLTVAAFGASFPRDERATRVDLVGPDGSVLDARAISPSAPTVTLAPFAGTSATWTASDADGDALSYSVFVSPDGGESWYDVVHETNATSAPIPAGLLAGASDPRVRVVATDGMRSAEATSPSTRPATPTTPPADATPPPDDEAGDDRGAAAAPGLGVVAVLAILSGLAWRRGRGGRR